MSEGKNKHKNRCSCSVIIFHWTQSGNTLLFVRFQRKSGRLAVS